MSGPWPPLRPLKKDEWKFDQRYKPLLPEINWGAWIICGLLVTLLIAWALQGMPW